MKKYLYLLCLLFVFFSVFPLISCNTTAAAEKQEHTRMHSVQSEQPETSEPIRLNDTEYRSTDAVVEEPPSTASPTGADSKEPQVQLASEHDDGTRQLSSESKVVSGQNGKNTDGISNDRQVGARSASEDVQKQQETETVPVESLPLAVLVPAESDRRAQSTDITRQSFESHSNVQGQNPIASTEQQAQAELEAGIHPANASGSPDTPEAAAAVSNSADNEIAFQPADAPAIQDYADSLADLISDFEDKGGSHGYQPPRSFRDEMLDLFSPHIFSVALSKEPETERKIGVSRSAALEEKQRLEIVYPGHGWVYIGEQTSQQGLRYEQRKLQDNTSIFTFTAEKKGNYVLHFSYFDVFSDDFITDAVAVSVGAAKASAAKTTVRAPEYTSAENGEQNSRDSSSETKTDAIETPSTQQFAKESPAVETAQGGHTGALYSEDKGSFTEPALTANVTNSATEGNATTPDELLQKAREAISAADAVLALQTLDLFFVAATKNLDEGWFLRGRAYELNGSARNIRLALDSYRTLTQAFPQSTYWAEADARIRYITNFYINIQ